MYACSTWHAFIICCTAFLNQLVCYPLCISPVPQAVMAYTLAAAFAHHNNPRSPLETVRGHWNSMADSFHGRVCEQPSHCNAIRIGQELGAGSAAGREADATVVAQQLPAPVALGCMIAAEAEELVAALFEGVAEASLPDAVALTTA
jgi:hypothetical protein